MFTDVCSFVKMDGYSGISRELLTVAEIEYRNEGKMTIPLFNTVLQQYVKTFV